MNEKNNPEVQEELNTVQIAAQKPANKSQVFFGRFFKLFN